MAVDGRRIAILGAGKIGEALVAGLLSSGWRSADDLVATTRREERAEELRSRHGVETTLSNAEAIAGAALVVVSVKPQDIEVLLGEIGALLTPEQTVLSIAAAIPTAFIERRLADGVPVVRAMPNTPSTVHEGMAGLAAGAHAGEGLGGRLRARWQGVAARASDGLVVKADATGKAEGIKRAHQTLDSTTETLLRARVAEVDPGQQGIIDQQIRDLHAGYVSTGLLSPQDAQARLLKVRDRIVHAKAFRRLKHKTQVFLSPEGDHYRVRLTHTLDVSQIARTAARASSTSSRTTRAT